MRRELASALAVFGLALGVAGLIVGSDRPTKAVDDYPYSLTVPGLGRSSSVVGPSSFEILFFDVGQGDATLITVNGQRLLIDSGRTGNTMLTRLAAWGITDLDAILATHPDADHTGGFQAVLGAFSVERVYLNGGDSTSQTFADFMAAVTAEGAQVTTLTRGDVVPLGGLNLMVFSPIPALLSDSNEGSIIVQLTCGSVDVLLTGDAEAGAEASMLGAGLITDVDVLKVGHHGSNTSSSAPFLAMANPEVGVVSAGLGNQFGHPHAETLQRLADVGAEVVYTDTGPGDDTVVMTSNCSTYSFSVDPQPPEPGATNTPDSTATNTPGPTATATAPGLPACALGGGDCNCSDFDTWQEAQSFHDTHDPDDSHGLDGDDNGDVCESLPGYPPGD